MRGSTSNYYSGIYALFRKASIHNAYKWGCACSFSTLNSDFYITQQWLQHSADTYHLQRRRSTSYYSRDLLLRLSLHASFFRSSARCPPSDLSHLIQPPYLPLSTKLPALPLSTITPLSSLISTVSCIFQLHFPLSTVVPLSSSISIASFIFFHDLPAVFLSVFCAHASLSALCPPPTSLISFHLFLQPSSNHPPGCRR